MTLEENKKTARRHIDLTWNKGHLALAEQLQSKDFIYRSALLGNSLPAGDFVLFIQKIRHAMPTLEAVVEECIAEGERVVTWSTLIGTIERPVDGYPVSDRVLSYSLVAFWTFNSSGEIREICTLLDMENVRAQLGLERTEQAYPALA